MMTCDWGIDSQHKEMICGDRASFRHQTLNRYYCETHGVMLREKYKMNNVIRLGTDPFDFEKRLGEWADSQFGAGGPLRCLKHLKEEVQEVIDASAPDDRLEYADCFMLLIDAYRRSGRNFQDLLDAADEKLKICKERKYLPPDSEGIIRHVK